MTYRPDSQYYERQTSTYYQDHQSTNYYGNRQDIATQGALDAWAPPRNDTARSNDYRDRANFQDPYTDLNLANGINRSRGFGAARATYLRAIQEADNINEDNIKADGRQNQADLDRIAVQLRHPNSSTDSRSLNQERNEIFDDQKRLKELYYAPANTRVSMAIACIKTGDPLEMAEGQRLIAEAKQKRPEIANDPQLQKMIDQAYQVAYRTHYPAQGRQESRQEPAPRKEPAPRQEPTQRQEPAPPPRVEQQPAPRVEQQQAQVREIPVPPRTVQPTEDIVKNSQYRISDSEALVWLHNRYKHLSTAEMEQNAKDAQKAHDDTSWSMNPIAPDWETRARGNAQDKQVEYSKGFRKDLDDLINTAKQPRSQDSDFARQALITIIKTSAKDMSNEPGNREISQEACECVRDLCKAGSPGRAQMVDAIRLGLTESANLPGGARDALIDGLNLLVTEQPPVLTREEAGKLTLAALKHECDNMPRLGAPDRKGDSAEQCNARQIRLIEMMDKLNYSAGIPDIQSIATTHPNEYVKAAAVKAYSDLQQHKGR